MVEVNGGAAGYAGRSIVPAGRAWWDPVRPGDEAAVVAQLARPARGLLAIAARCRWGKPLVTVTCPLLPGDGGRPEPFPTTFWLTCPYLVAAVSRLESRGWIGRLAQAFAADPKRRKELEATHRSAATMRRELLQATPLWRSAEIPATVRARLESSGVAGIRDFVAVKCLHAHLADHLGRGGNVVGRWVVHTLAREGVGLSGHPECPGTPGRAGGATCGLANG